MRLMARLARHSVGVIGWINLGEAFGLGSARRVTSRAKYTGIRFHRRNRRWIVRMPGERSMARFTVHVRMLAFALHVEHVAVTGFTGPVSGEFDRMGRNLADRIAAIVAVLSEAFRDHVTSDDKENNESENKESRESEEMPYIFEDTHCSRIS
jgi:hypothetical protein